MGLQLQREEDGRRLKGERATPERVMGADGAQINWVGVQQHLVEVRSGLDERRRGLSVIPS